MQMEIRWKVGNIMKGKHRPEKQRVVNTQKGIKRTLILCAAYLMEEDGWDDDRIIDFYNGIVRWSDAVDQHFISINNVIEMVNDKTGLQIRW